MTREANIATQEKAAQHLNAGDIELSLTRCSPRIVWIMTRLPDTSRSHTP